MRICSLKNPLPKNEHLGIDEEIMYLEKEPVNALNVLVPSSKGKYKEYAHEDEDDSEDESEGDKDEVKANEELVGDKANHNPNVEYDKRTL